MIEDALLTTVGVTILLFGLQAFLSADRRKFANEMIKAASQVIMGMFILYFSYNFAKGRNIRYE
jgi:hypothetical protein